jgi:hypothetical protein
LTLTAYCNTRRKKGYREAAIATIFFLSTFPSFDPKPGYSLRYVTAPRMNDMGPQANDSSYPTRYVKPEKTECRKQVGMNDSIVASGSEFASVKTSSQTNPN